MQLNSKILTSTLLVELQKEEKFQELGYLKMACLSHIRYHGFLLWNEIAVDWLSVAMWFGTCSCLGGNADTWFSTSTVYDENHVVWYTQFL